MANDPWASFNPQPVSDTKAPGADTNPGAAPEADPWAAFQPQPDYNSLPDIPQAFKDRLAHGQTLGTIADAQGLQQDSAWHSIWDAAKKGAAAGYDAEGLANTFRDQRRDIQNFTGPNGDQLGGWKMLETGVEASENFYHVLRGAFVGASAAGSQAVSRAAGIYGNPNATEDAIDMVTRPYSPDIPSIADIASQTTAFEMLPAIVSRNGEFARVTRDPQSGKLGAQVVGTMPKPEDFKEAAQSISSNPVTEHKVKAQWDTYGLHPHEVQEIAAESPTHASDLSSAKAPLMPLPPRPSPTYLKEIDDNFFKLRMSHQADYSEMAGRLQKMGEIDPEVDKKLYSYMEGDTHYEKVLPNGEKVLEPLRLAPEEAQFFNEHIQPLKKEELERYERLKQTELPVDQYDPTYMHRMVVGKTPELDRFSGEASQVAPQFMPNTGMGQGLLSRQTSATQPRSYFSLVDEEGNRRLVRMSNDGKSIRTVDGKTVKDASSLALDLDNEKFRKGEQYTIDGKSYTLSNAFTREIEANTNLKYYKSGIANTVNNVIHLRSADRAMYRVQQMRDTPEWNAYTTRGGQWEPNWISPDMPIFRNDVMDPKMAHIINDFYGSKDSGAVLDQLERVNNWSIGSLFWTPIPHAMNAGAFWTMDRAWENITPKGMASLFRNGATAIREVVTQGPKYQDAMRAGGSFQYAPIANRDFYPQMLKQIGHNIETHPEGWEGLAKLVGETPARLIGSFYDASNKMLWAASDMFKMQRVLELQDLKGMSTEEAVKHTEQYTPAYRIPSQIFGDRTIRQIYANPIIFEFSRYHYDIMKSYANMAKDLAVGNAEQRLRATGSLLALAGLQLVIWPAMSYMLQQATGNDELRVPSFGPGRITEPLWSALVNKTPTVWPKFIRDYYGDNNKTFLDAMRGLIPMSPGATMLFDMYTNRYSYSGRPIAEPSDIRNNRWGRVAGQEAEHAGRTMVEPYNMFADAWKHDEAPGNVLLKNIFGLQEQTQEKEAAKQRAFRYQDRAARTRNRENKAVGPLEFWINHSPVGELGGE